MKFCILSNSLLFLFGFFSGPQVLVYTIAKEQCTVALLATAFAFNNFIIMMGGLIFQPFVGRLLDFHNESISIIESTTNIYSNSNYLYALSILPIGLFLAFCLTLFLSDKKNSSA